MFSYERIMQSFSRNRKANNRIKLLRTCLSLFVFAITYLLLTQDAITMENKSASEVTCEVWHDSTATSELSESEPEIEEETLDNNAMVMTFAAVNSVASIEESSEATDEGDGTDFTDNITEFTISIKNGNTWEEATTFQDGDEIQVYIAYTIQVGDGENVDEIYYQLPDVIQLSGEMTGSVTTPAGLTVGQYIIYENGLIVIEFNDDFDTSVAYNGSITFTGSVEAAAGNEDKDIVFDGNDLDFTYEEKDDEQESTKTYDLSTGKTVSSENEDGSYDYTVTISSTNGTNEETIDVTDEFLVTTTGGQNATYDDTSFTITKTLADGTTETISSPSVSVDNNNTKSTFSIEDLLALGEGESYTITYSATPIVDTDNTTSNGSMSLGNKVNAKSDTLQDDSTVSAQISGAVVDKTGSYDANSQTATWTINIDPGVQDLSGYTIEDTVTASDGTVIVLEGATITSSDGTVYAITLPYTFPEDFDNTLDYTITYKADLSGLSSNQSITVKNEVEIYDDDQVFEDIVTLPTIYNQTYDITKEFLEVEASENQYQWTTSIVIPETTDEIVSDLVYTDSINTTLTSTSGNVQNAHYTTVGDLRNIVVTVGGNVINSDNYTISFISLDYTHYADATISNTAVPDEQEVRTFVVTFTEGFIEAHVGETISMDYYTYIDTENTVVNGIYTIQNSAKVGNSTVTADTTYTKVQGIDKQSKVSGGSYTSDPQNYEYEIVYDESLGYAVMTYRVAFLTEVYSLDELASLTLTDTLPEGTSLITDSVTYYFGTPWQNQTTGNFYDARFTRDYGHVYASDYLSCYGTGISGESEVISFFLTEEFFEDYELLSTVTLNYVTPLTFYIEYKIALTDPSEWDGETSHTFVNSLEYGSEIIENEVTLESDQQFVTKSGVQETTTDSQGNVTYTDNVNYTIIANQDEQNLNANGDTVTLTDTMEFVGANGATATLVSNKFFVYEYDPTQPDGKGEELTTEEYGYTTEVIESTSSTQYIFYLTIPDDRALLIEYTYYVNTSEDKTAGNFSISNSVSLDGSSAYEDEGRMEIVNSNSSATVQQQSLTLFKYELGNEAISLEGATFYFEKYKDANGDGDCEWVETAFGTDSTLTTDEDGIISFNLYNSSGVTHYEVGVLYRFTETVAPEGYRLDNTPRYFVFVEEGWEDNTLDYAQYIDIPDGVYIKDIIFIVNDQTIIPISNEKNVVEVKKNWVDEDGERISATQDTITIELYRQETEPVDSHTISVTSTAEGTTSSDGTTERNIEKTLSVCEGSDLLIAVFNSADVTQQFTVNGVTETGFVDPLYPNIVYYRIYDITADMEITIQAVNAEGMTYDYYFFEFEQAAYEATGDKEYVGTYTLTQSDNWTMEWKLNDDITGDGYLPYSPEDSDCPYYYSVVESSVPSGFTVTYSDTNITGINSGEITITNIKNPYALPSTGSTGGMPFKILGVAVFMVTACIYITIINNNRKKGEKLI